MKKLYKESAGCFLIDPESHKVIMTIKTIDATKANIIRALIDNQVITAKTVLDVEWHCSFTKGKIEGDEDPKYRAIKESEEEAGIAEDDILIENTPIGSFEKKKKYTNAKGKRIEEEKKVTMYIAKIQGDYDLDKLNPTDSRHVAIALPIDQVGKFLKKSEKNFWKSDTVQIALNDYLDNINDLSSQHDKQHVSEIDIGN